MGIQFDRINTTGAHAASLNFSKAQEVTTGQRIDFSKENPNVTKVRIELYWTGNADGDASVLLLDSNKVALPGVTSAERQVPTGPNGQINPNKTRGMVWYNNESVPGVVHSGDVTEADDDPSSPEETIKVDLAGLEADANEVLVVASTFPDKDDPAQKPVPFGRLRNCRVMVVNDLTNEVLYVYELDEDFSQFTSVELASFYKRNGEWRYTSMGEGVGKSAQALSDIASKYKLA